MDEPRSPSEEGTQTPYEMKELFIEACVRQWREGNFSEVVGPNNLEAMSLLDSNSLEDNIEAGSSIYSGPDLFACLQHEVSSDGREKWLKQHLSTSLQDEYIKQRVAVLLDEDLKAAGILKLIGPRRLADKVSTHVYRHWYGAELTSNPAGQSGWKPSTEAAYITNAVARPVRRSCHKDFHGDPQDSYW